MEYFVVGMLALGAILIITVLEQARANRLAGLTPDGTPLPRVNELVRATLDAPLSHGARTLLIMRYDPTTVEGIVTSLNDDLTLTVMDEYGELHRCMQAHWVPLDEEEQHAFFARAEQKRK